MRHKWRICDKSDAFDICRDEVIHPTKFRPNRTINVKVTAFGNLGCRLAWLGFEPMTFILPHDVYFA